MPRAFTQIAFTPAVRALQQERGSRAAYAKFDTAADAHDELSEAEREFIEARDSFFQATVGETGWPYVQHRGGPKGFLRVLDAKTIAYADLSGNMQFVSAGNLSVNNKVALILMDQPNRQRLKLWGTVRTVDVETDPQAVQCLQVPGYGVPERAFIITVHAFDWNCSRHITPRFSQEELSEILAPLQQELAALRAEVARLRSAGKST